MYTTYLKTYLYEHLYLFILLQSRCMCSVLADTENHRFLVATNSYKKQNEVHVLNYSEDTNRIELESVFNIDLGEVWSMSASPYD